MFALVGVVSYKEDSFEHLKNCCTFWMSQEPMQEWNLYLALRYVKCEHSTLFQAPTICEWFQRYFTPKKKPLVVFEAVICEVFEVSLEMIVICEIFEVSLEMILLWIQVASGPLHSHFLCQQYSSFLSFFGSFLIFLQVSP